MRAMELKVAIQTEDYEAAAQFLTKISEIISEHGDVIRMSTSLEEITVRDRQVKMEVSAEAESHPLDEIEAPIDMGIPVTEIGPGLAPEEDG